MEHATDSGSKQPELPLDGNAKPQQHDGAESVISEVSLNSSSSSGSSSRSGEKQNQAASRPRPMSRARSLLARSLSRTQSQPQQPQADLAPVTRTVSEVRGDIYYERDVEIGEIERERAAEQDGGTGEKGPFASASAADGPDGLPDPNLVRWDGPDDPENPKNWRMKRKWACVFVVSLYGFLTPVASNMIAPALPAIAKELDIHGSTEQLMTLSVFVLAYAFGPLFLGPLSEVYGRVGVLQVANVIFILFNLGCGLAQTRGQMMALRFLAGLSGSAPLALGGGLLSDLFTAEQRGVAMSMYSLAPLLGPSVGPIMGAFIAQQTSWRWVFYATTMGSAAVQCVGMVLVRETYAPVLLARRRARLTRETGNTALYTVAEREREAGGLAHTLSIALRRPFVLLGSQIIVQVLALYVMYLYGLMYLMLSTFPTLWREVYHQPLGLAGLNYIASGLGFTLGTQLLARLQDRIYVALKRHYGVAVGRPEFRVPIMVPGAVLVPVGLLIYGWCAEYHTHWIGPDIGIAVMCTGLIAGFQCIQGYLVDTYSRYAASAVSATTFMRSLAGFGFPLFAPDLIHKLGYGRGNTVLAGIGIAVGWPAPFLLWKYGELLRKKSPYAAG
ncbi:major facilitator superfamily transporter multidrug resistance [Grosmannia clavigera kw1407]|uniref:Major facilitator superfamily transporter multidrug resistance n=1 Tax=Grosmannia clavigera (strain kw1407 / UAMH 11150) TaxID=655863 RepID=F0XHU8_GROCL|nr:major facilitator superfamily transporter multidrug resistance [Grosmannia clavigera kw1407]EFX02800.1 major facilitator superfamily transporter multidrug resistance [Grosmannia clavigera kw1407]